MLSKKASRVKETLNSFAGYVTAPRIVLKYLDGNELKAYLALLDSCIDDDECTISINRIIQKVGSSYSTVWKSINRLDGTFIRIIKNKGKRNIYKLFIPDFIKEDVMELKQKEKAQFIVDEAFSKTEEVKKKVQQRRAAKVIYKKTDEEIEMPPSIKCIIEEYTVAFKRKFPNEELPVWHKKELGQAKKFLEKMRTEDRARKVIRYVFLCWDKLNKKWKIDGYPTIGILLVYATNLIIDKEKTEIEKPKEKEIVNVDTRVKVGW